MAKEATVTTLDVTPDQVRKARKAYRVSKGDALFEILTDPEKTGKADGRKIARRVLRAEFKGMSDEQIVADLLAER